MRHSHVPQEPSYDLVQLFAVIRPSGSEGRAFYHGALLLPSRSYRPSPHRTLLLTGSGEVETDGGKALHPPPVPVSDRF